MNSNGLVKARNAFLVLQILASILIIIAAIVSFVSLNELKTNYKAFECFYGAVMTARVGAIIVFIISIITSVATYFCSMTMGKSIGGIVISVGMFILNFVLYPFSSSDNYVHSVLSGNSSNVFSSQPAIIILLVLSVIMIGVSGMCLNEQSEVNTTAISPTNLKNSWTCPRCNTINSLFETHCSECNEKRPSATSTGDTPPGTKKCGYCGATMQSGALICRICGKTYQPPKPEAKAETKSVEAEKTKPQTKICTYCGATISSDGEFCGKCGKKITPPAPPKKANTCVFCGAEIPAGNKFCGICGKPISTEKTCQKCGEKIPLGNSFCGKCGTKINPD